MSKEKVGIDESKKKKQNIDAGPENVIDVENKVDENNIPQSKSKSLIGAGMEIDQSILENPGGGYFFIVVFVFDFHFLIFRK